MSAADLSALTPLASYREAAGRLACRLDLDRGLLMPNGR